MTQTLPARASFSPQTEEFLSRFLPALQEEFGDRLWFCGLQGSRSRGEEKPDSDLDMVVVLDSMDMPDVYAYRDLLDRLPLRELSCGFLSGKAELFSWDPSDLFQFCHDTVPLIGSLEEVAGLCSRDDVRHAAWAAACSIYHQSVHNIVHQQSTETLSRLLKNAYFAVCALQFIKSGRYIGTFSELLAVSEDEDRGVLLAYERLRNGETPDLETETEVLFEWARGILLLFPDADTTEED